MDKSRGPPGHLTSPGTSQVVLKYLKALLGANTTELEEEILLETRPSQNPVCKFGNVCRREVEPENQIDFYTPSSTGFFVKTSKKLNGLVIKQLKVDDCLVIVSWLLVIIKQ